MTQITRGVALAPLAALIAVGLTAPVHAHFQLLYTPEVRLADPADVPFKLVFGHPMENSNVMDMGEPERFVVVFKGEETDLKGTLTPITWKGPQNEAKAYEATYKVRRNGDYVFALVPAPYLEEAEGAYIQQITKTLVNKGGMPTGWSEPLGLPTEIVPLNKPYQIFAGSTFSGQLLSEGKPAPGVECEIEYINVATSSESATTCHRASRRSRSGPAAASSPAIGRVRPCSIRSRMSASSRSRPS
jgi:cobalt/nickel transport protein